MNNIRSRKYTEDTDIYTDSSVIRARSHKYPDDTDIYTDTTHFDKREKSLDIGFQRLKYVNLKSYPELSNIKSLYIDHNNLTNLPNAKDIPNLTTLDCSYNKLSNIPFYPNLTLLIIHNNTIKNINLYNNSKLKYIDCSFNLDIELNINLPNCTNLYITDCNLKILNLDLFPKIKILDCENNKLTKLGSSQTLIELGTQNNLLNSLSKYPNLIRLYADNNNINIIDYTFEKIVLLSVNHNCISQIKSQPILEKLYASHNKIIKLGSMPNIITIDIPHNNLTECILSNNIEHAHLYFNPIISLKLEFLKIKELQISFNTYKNIYQSYKNEFKFTDIHICVEKLDKILSKMNNIFNQKLTILIKQKIIKIKFIERDTYLFQLTLLLYLKIFNTNGIETVDNLVKTKEFSRLFEIVKDIYYKTLIITYYFNGYRM